MAGGKAGIVDHFDDKLRRGGGDLFRVLPDGRDGWRHDLGEKRAVIADDLQVLRHALLQRHCRVQHCRGAQIVAENAVRFRVLTQKPKHDLAVIVEGVRVAHLLVGDAVDMVLCHDVTKDLMADIPGCVVLKRTADLDDVAAAAAQQAVGSQRTALHMVGGDIRRLVADVAVNGDDREGQAGIVLLGQFIVENNCSIDAVVVEELDIVLRRAGAERRVAQENLVSARLEKFLEVGDHLGVIGVGDGRHNDADHAGAALEQIARVFIGVVVELLDGGFDALARLLGDVAAVVENARGCPLGHAGELCNII